MLFYGSFFGPLILVINSFDKIVLQRKINFRLYDHFLTGKDLVLSQGQGKGQL